jgi:hypothetical protein
MSSDAAALRAISTNILRRHTAMNISRLPDVIQEHVDSMFCPPTQAGA